MREFQLQQHVIRVRQMRDRAIFFMDNGNIIRVVDAEVEPTTALQVLQPWFPRTIGHRPLRDQLVQLFEEGFPVIGGRREMARVGHTPPGIVELRSASPPPRRRLSETQIEGLPKTASPETVTCAVCLDDVPAGELLTSLPCAHAFHTRCIETWMRKSVTCPVCRGGAEY